MEYKKATLKDIDNISEIIKIAINHMKEENNPQWVYHDLVLQSIINYINNNQYYLAVRNNEIVGMFALLFEEDDTYKVINIF